MERLSYEFVKKEFEKEDYILLTKKYINNYQKMDYICPNSHKHSIMWYSWQQGCRCPYCYGNVKFTIKFIKSEFQKEGYILLTKIYKNNKQKLSYICPNGHKHSIIWNAWQRGHRCPHCVGQGKPVIEFIKNEFEKENYILLIKEYKNSSQKLDYICPNKHKHKITWANWQQGYRCPICAMRGLSLRYCGSGNPAWKGGISCEPYCFEWSSKEFKDFIKERDRNKCLNPDCWGNCNHLPLHIHHIDYNKKNCGPTNLITLCASCNARANKDREWHKAWYQAIMNKKYIYHINKEKLNYYVNGGNYGDRL